MIEYDRAIDSHGLTLDFELRKHRDYQSAYHFLKRLLTTYGRRSTPQKLVDFFQNLPQSFLFSTFFNKKHLKTLLYQHLFSYYKNVVVSI